MAELIVALDVASRAEAEEKVKLLGGDVEFYKIGLELFSAEGPDVVKAVKGLGKKVFLDLKLHDIPRTVARAVKSGAALGVDLMTVHAVGGNAMVRAAADAAAEFGASAPKILAVTVLTSLDQSDLRDIGISGRTPAEQVRAAAFLAVASGADGLVSSPLEVPRRIGRGGPEARGHAGRRGEGRGDASRRRPPDTRRRRSRRRRARGAR